MVAGAEPSAFLMEQKASSAARAFRYGVLKTAVFFLILALPLTFREKELKTLMAKTLFSDLFPAEKSRWKITKE